MKPKSFRRQLVLFASLAFTLALSMPAATVTKAATFARLVVTQVP